MITFQSKAQVSVGEKGEFSGLVFGDYYWIANHHQSDLENQNGFWFRRVYLTYDHTFSDAFSSRLRLEMNSAGDFESDPEMVPDVKDAYLKWQNDRHQIIAGIAGVPALGRVEDVWGYRSVEKSPLDLYSYTSSRDFGLSFKGKIDKADKLNYHFFIGNGNSNKPEVDKGKKLMFSLAYNITEHLVVEGYADWNDAPNADTYTAQLFAAYRSEKFNLGALGAFQDNGPLNQISEADIDLVSLFTNVTFNEKFKAYLRTDHHFESYAGGSDNSYLPFAEGVDFTFIVGGLDILLEEQIHLMPNIESIFYGENTAGITPSTDIIPRLTLFYEF
jgi:hypothetical protein